MEIRSGFNLATTGLPRPLAPAGGGALAPTTAPTAPGTVPDASVALTPASAASADSPKADGTDAERAPTPTPIELTPEDLNALRYLQKRDQEVRNHEQAHLMAGGAYVNGGASFTYQTGPDRRQYAIGGEVSIDAAPVTGDPEATAQKARVITRAALAPADPSSQDLRVAAQAQAMLSEAQAELRVAARAAATGEETEAEAQTADDGVSQETPDASVAAAAEPPTAAAGSGLQPAGPTLHSAAAPDDARRDPTAAWQRLNARLAGSAALPTGTLFSQYG